MPNLKIIVAFSIFIDAILIVAYIELHAIMLWYKKQFNSKPRAYHFVEKQSWQRRLINILLLRKPVSTKQPFKPTKLNEEKIFVRTET
jgi:hypothetical protein